MSNYNILILGASYGSLLASKILFGGHSVKLVCLPAEAELINSEGFRVRIPLRGRDEQIELDSRKLPGRVSAAGATEVDPGAYEMIRRLEKDIDAVRFDAPEGKIELPVKLRFYDSVFVPLAKWAMLMAGNYRCITENGIRTAQEAVHSNLEHSRSIYNFVLDVCVKLGASLEELVPFEKYAAAAESLSRPASAARALNNGAPNIERADKLVQLVAKQNGMSHPVLDEIVALVDRRLEANRKAKASAA